MMGQYPTPDSLLSRCPKAENKTLNYGYFCPFLLPLAHGNLDPGGSGIRMRIHRLVDPSPGICIIMWKSDLNCGMASNLSLKFPKGSV